MDSPIHDATYTTAPHYARGATGAVYASGAVIILAVLLFDAGATSAVEWLALAPLAVLFGALLCLGQRVVLESAGLRVTISGFTIRRITWDVCGSAEPVRIRLWTHGAGIRFYGGGRMGLIMSGGYGVTVHNMSGRGSTTISLGTETERDALLAVLSARGIPTTNTE